MGLRASLGREPGPHLTGGPINFLHPKTAGFPETSENKKDAIEATGNPSTSRKASKTTNNFILSATIAMTIS